jgi:two-component system NtrC family response regulator
LIIDDEPLFSGLLAGKIGEMQHEATCASSLQEGLVKADNNCYDVVYLDVRLPDGNGIDQINRIKNARSQPEVIIMTGGGDADGAELAIVNGAWDYIEKPSSVSSMILPLVRALQYREIMMKKKPAAALKHEGIVAGGQRMLACLDKIGQAAGSDACALILGETGTGKELVAWAIHNNSSRSKRNFVVVDCASLSETLVESVLFGHTRGAYTGADTAQEGADPSGGRRHPVSRRNRRTAAFDSEIFPAGAPGETLSSLGRHPGGRQ